MTNIKQLLFGSTLTKITSIGFLLGCAALIYFNFFNQQDRFDIPAYQSPLTQEEAQASATLAALRVDGRIVSVAYTGSMRPILDGNCYLVHVSRYHQTQVGDIVIFDREGQSIVHLVFDVLPTGLRTKATSGQGWDLVEITENEYIGTVVAIFPFREK